jgi:hypothetical protein
MSELSAPKRAKHKFRHREWTKAEDREVRTGWLAGEKAEQTAGRLHERTPHAVNCRRRALGLQSKSEERRFKTICVYIPFATAERIAGQAAKAGITLGARVRQMILGREHAPPPVLTAKSRLYLTREALRRGVDVVEFASTILDAVAERNLAAAVLTDLAPSQDPRTQAKLLKLPTGVLTLDTVKGAPQVKVKGTPQVYTGGRLPLPGCDVAGTAPKIRAADAPPLCPTNGVT